MEERFLECLQFVLKWEGGLTQDPDDRGGRTFRGVTQATYDRYRKVKKLPLRDVAQMSEDEMREIYYTFYWFPAKCHLLPKPLDLVHFDTAVNMGVGRAGKFLQETVNHYGGQVAVDGIVGNQTLSGLKVVLEKVPVKIVCQYYLSLRKLFYHSVVARNPSQRKFLRGWLNRVEDLERVVRAPI